MWKDECKNEKKWIGKCEKMNVKMKSNERGGEKR